ncbi:MAG: tRNA (adenosine(37)-N6)-threonylcarbamoyltransferase complex ATPase subunit type 1 TsaE [Chitinophagia bacterium]|nr:tRNA (adenosine(37)-N6)-threonylcarbamoyltransferase complex ATPase subunit type 1 TsaE [Chitinophagia bacterium]
MAISYLCIMKREYSFAELDQVAAQLWEEGKSHRIWAFFAPMGAGKTTLIARLCSFLQISDMVSSPTFSIMNEYQLPDGQRLYHMDWYRLSGMEEAIQAGVEEKIISNDRCWIEWPERAPELLPADTFSIHIRVVDELNRGIETVSGKFP